MEEKKSGRQVLMELAEQVGLARENKQTVVVNILRKKIDRITKRMGKNKKANS